MPRLGKPISYAGSKFYLADKIISLMPQHTHYCEPYFGSGAVLFRKNPEGSEVVNDIDGRLMNFWQVLQDRKAFKIFAQFVQLIPFAESEFRRAEEISSYWILDALRFFILVRQSRQGLMRDFATLSRNRTRRSMNEQVSSWLSAIDGLPEIHQRLQRIVILNEDAIEVIKSQDGPNTLFYLDPPYLHSTRTSKNLYKYEMTEKDHEKLLDLIRFCKSKFIVSTYPNQFYAKRLIGWNYKIIKIDNKASSCRTKPVMSEVLYYNF